MKHFSNRLMFHTLIFLFFDRDEMHRNVFHTSIFLKRKISHTSKMFYSKDTQGPWAKGVSVYIYCVLMIALINNFNFPYYV